MHCDVIFVLNRKTGRENVPICHRFFKGLGGPWTTPPLVTFIVNRNKLVEKMYHLFQGEGIYWTPLAKKNC